MQLNNLSAYQSKSRVGFLLFPLVKHDKCKVTQDKLEWCTVNIQKGNEAAILTQLQIEKLDFSNVFSFNAQIKDRPQKT